jgi:hypothetical protein
VSDLTTTPIVTQSPSNRAVARKLTLLIIKTAGAYTVGALMGVDWSEMSHQQQFLIVVAGVVAIATAIEAFYDKTSANAATGAAAIASGNTPPPFAVQPPKPNP